MPLGCSGASGADVSFIFNVDLSERFQPLIHGSTGEPLGGSEVPFGEWSQSEPPY